MAWADGTETISNYSDLIDSREVIARIEHLANLEQLAADSYVPASEQYGEIIDDDEIAELASLRALAEEASGYAEDWEYGETLIRDSYFETYAQDLAEDIGAINRDATWPNTCIDWEQASRELQMDYTSVDFDGVTYWIR